MADAHEYKGKGNGGESRERLARPSAGGHWQGLQETDKTGSDRASNKRLKSAGGKRRIQPEPRLGNPPCTTWWAVLRSVFESFLATTGKVEDFQIHTVCEYPEQGGHGEEHDVVLPDSLVDYTEFNAWMRESDGVWLLVSGRTLVRRVPDGYWPFMYNDGEEEEEEGSEQDILILVAGAVREDCLNNFKCAPTIARDAYPAAVRMAATGAMPAITVEDLHRAQVPMGDLMDSPLASRDDHTRFREVDPGGYTVYLRLASLLPQV
jgi:hypothetical protein